LRLTIPVEHNGSVCRKYVQKKKRHDVKFEVCFLALARRERTNDRTKDLQHDRARQSYAWSFVGIVAPVMKCLVDSILRVAIYDDSVVVSKSTRKVESRIDVRICALVKIRRGNQNEKKDGNFVREPKLAQYRVVVL
jgi:hypothetical protein